MTDVSMAVEQDAIAESLLGEPEEQTVEATGTEQQEVQTEPQQVEAEAESQTEEAEDWLPTDQDKIYPDDVYARYAQRYQLTPEQAADPLLRQLLHDKINTDIFVRQQQQQAEQWEQQQQEVETQQEPTPQQPLSREQWFQNLDQVVQQTTDPQVAKAFHADFLRAFGIPEDQIAAVPPQQAMQFTSVASKYMLNLISTHLPGLLQNALPQQISHAFPGFGDMYERSSYAMAWDQVRNSNPKFSDLPAYGTKQFSQTLRAASQQIPGFDEMQFTDARGNPLQPQQNAMRKYEMLAKIASGQNVDPALLQKAVATGQAQQRRAATRRAAGNLGSGQSKAGSGATTSSRFQSNQDLFDDDTMELYQREHGRM